MDDNYITDEVKTNEALPTVLLTIEYQGDKQYVLVPYEKQNICFPTYYDILSAARTNWKIAHEIQLKIVDNNGIEVKETLYHEFIYKFNFNLGLIEIRPVILTDITNLTTPTTSCSSVFTTVTNDSTNSGITSDDWKKPDFLEVQVLKDLKIYFGIQTKILVNGNELLHEYENNKLLSDRDRRAAVNIITNHLLSLRPHPKKIDKITWAKCAVKLFPSLRAKGEGQEGYETFYDPIIKGGWMGNRLKTLRKTEAKKIKIFKNSKENSPTPEKEEELSEYQRLDEEYHMLEIIEKLKYADPKHDKKLILHGMKQTFKLRRNFILSNQCELILLEYPRFIDTYQLIHNDFEILYPNSYSNLKTKFTTEFCERIKQISIGIGKSKPVTEHFKDWHQDISIIFYLLSLLPATQKGRGAKNRSDFKTAGNKIIKFVGINDQISADQHLIIFAQGESKSSISKFYISLDNKLIPTNNTILDGLDLLFKSHFVFNVKYADNLDNFFKYIQHYIFHIPSQKLPTTVKYCNTLLNPDS